MQTEFTVDKITVDMLDMLEATGNVYEFHVPEPEMIDVVSYGKTPYQIAGNQLPPTITITNEQDALLFHIKYAEKILQVITSEKKGMIWD